ncbi:hypothetical protein EZS27_040160, partial [termite gut metagenome]
MKKILIMLVWSSMTFFTCITQAQVIRVASYNLRMDTPQDSL